MYLKHIIYYIMIALLMDLGCLLPSYGQHSVAGSLAKRMTHFHKLKPIQVSLALSNRVERTYLQAIVKQHLSQMENFQHQGLGATEYFLSASMALDETVYPETQFLTTNRQRTKYFLVRQNREMLRQLPLLQNHFADIRQHLNDLRKHMRDLNPTLFADSDARALTAVISPRTSYLLLGEGIHHSPMMMEQVTHVLQAMRARAPDQQIILFTEFLPKEQIWHKDLPEIPFADYLPVWRKARQLNIPVIGLEPSFVFDNFYATIDLNDGNSLEDGSRTKTVSMWATLEGIRLRNEDWLTTLRKYRQKYPQALFIVYAGADHVDYAFPFSIGHTLAGPSTHVTILQPEKARDLQGNITDKFSLFDQASGDQFTQRQLVRIDNRKLAKLAGFDTRWRIAVSLDSAN